MCENPWHTHKRKSVFSVIFLVLAPFLSSRLEEMPKGEKRTGEEGRKQAKKAKNESQSSKASSTPDNGKEPRVREKIKLEGSKHVGTLLFCGATNWDLIGRKHPPKSAGGVVKASTGPNLKGPNRLSSLNSVRVRSVVSGPTSCHNVIITDQGKAMSWGRNDCEQLGHGDHVRRDSPTLIETLKEFNIVSASCGRNHTLCLTEEGSVYAFGDNKFGQIGIGQQNPSVGIPIKITYKGPPIVKTACGADFSMVLDCRGNLYSFGHPEYGQLGLNNDGKYFVTCNKLAFDCQLTPRRVMVFVEKTRDGHIMPANDVDIKDIVCGSNHTLALDAKKRIFTWGFGGYGRLGHAEPKDEMIPRNVKFFDMYNKGAKSIYAGSAFSMAISELGQLYFWGKSKRTGEATMYPKPVPDLTGWDVRSVGCSQHSIVVAADESTISWGPSPTYGELGYGDLAPQSSTQPKEVKPLDGVHVHTVTCGMGHTLMIARDDTEEERKKLQTLPQFSP